MWVRSVRAAVALRRGVDLVGLPVAVPAAHTVWVWCGFPSGSFTVARATLGGRATNDLADECGEVTGGIEITIERESALIAAECPFGQAQIGYHHATPPNRSWNWDTTCPHPQTVPTPNAGARHRGRRVPS